MTAYHEPAAGGNASGLPFSGLPLFDWAARSCPPRPLHALIIARRYGLPEATAAVVCELSGIGGAHHE